MKGHIGLITAGLLCPALCLAEASDYNYVEATHLQGEVSDIRMDGWGAGGSFELTEKFFVAGEALSAEVDESAFDLDVDQARIGVGYVFGENSTGSVFGRVSYVRSEFSSSGLGVSDEDDGYELALGMRMNLNEQAELKATVAHLELDSGGSDTLPQVGLVYSFTETVAGVVLRERERIRNLSRSLAGEPGKDIGQVHPPLDDIGANVADDPVEAEDVQPFQEHVVRVMPGRGYQLAPASAIA